jgi:serine/threonine protein kinase
MRPHPSEAKAIFLNAMELATPAERQAYLDSKWGADVALRREVEDLLRHFEGMGSFLEEGVQDSAVPKDARPMPHQSDAIIGPYKLLEQIGEGGMGLVFMAEQEQPVRRKVALKILKPGLDTRQVVARFEAERHALALMDHPNIAQIFDGGTTAAGRPYFVMELVRGVPFTDFCDQNRTSVRERLELFRAVCQAVQHAHHKGIIHRDLKPSNVMVTWHDDRAVVKVIDFGIAKATGQQLTDKTLFTNFAQMIGTPMYMSPEQAQGLDIDTRTDIYSLGVLLYELLTGTTPFDKERLETAAYDEVRRIIREEEPGRPSTRISTLGPAGGTAAAKRQSDPRRLSQLCRGELDWIVMKCLEKDRSRRYETASGLARDLERFLHDEPVLACQPSAGYLFRKFARRNKGTLVTVGLVALALVAGTLISSWQAIRATRAEALAIASLQKAREAVDKMFTQVAEKWLAQQPGLEPMQRRFLEDALRFYEEFAEEGGTEPVLRLDTANAQRRVGEIQRKLGEYAKSEPAFSRGIAVLERLVAEFPSEGKYRSALADSHYQLAHLLVIQCRLGEAEKHLRQSLLLREKVVAESPDVATYRLALASSYSALGRVQIGARAAEESHHRAASILEDLPTDLAGTPECRRQLAIYRVGLGMALASDGRANEAEKSLQQAVDLFEKLVAEFPSEPLYRHELVWALHAFGTALREIRVEEAEQATRRALAIAHKLIIDFPTVPEYQVDIGLCHYGLGCLLQEAGPLQEAEQAFRQAVHLFEKLVFQFPNVPGYQAQRLEASYKLGQLVLEDGRLQEAEQIRRETLTVQERLLAQFPAVTEYRHMLALSHHFLGEVLAEAGRPQEAHQAYQEAVASWEKLMAEFPTAGIYRQWLANCHANLAELFATSPEANFWDPAQAVQHAKKAVELDPRGGLWNMLGIAYYRTGDWQAAVSALKKSTELREGGDCGDWFFLAMAHWKLDHKEEARRWHARAVAWMEEKKPRAAHLRRFRAEAAAVLGATEANK